MAGARVALPAGGNPISSSALVNFQLPDSAGAGVPTSVLGWAAIESTGSAAAKIRLHDGSTTAGPELAPLISLASGGAVGPVNFPNGLQVASGKVFVEVVSGSVELVVYW